VQASPAQAKPSRPGEGSAARQPSPAPAAAPGGADGPPAAPKAGTPPASTKKPAPAGGCSKQQPSAERSADERATATAAAGAQLHSGASEKRKRNSGSCAAAASEVVQVSSRCTERSGGDARVKLLKPLSKPPAGNTVLAAHKLPSLQGAHSMQMLGIQCPLPLHHVWTSSCLGAHSAVVATGGDWQLHQGALNFHMCRCAVL
jgi:hypothetical protein